MKISVPIMNYKEALEKGTAYLESCGIAEASLDSWYLLEYCCGITRTRYLLEKFSLMPEEEQKRYQELLERRGKRIPLQHITGEQEFMGFSFLVNDQVLIPRQDTEILVEEARKVIRPGMHVLDLCTGSGCIIISLWKLCSRITGIGADLSREALNMAKKNAERLEAEVSFAESDLLEQVDGNFDVLVSNPPYIPTSEIEGLMEEVRLHDPWMALDGREDGLYFYRKIVEESSRCLKQGGWLLFEIGCDQGEAVSDLMRRKQYTEVRVVQDLAGLDRVVLGRRS